MSAGRGVHGAEGRQRERNNGKDYRVEGGGVQKKKM